MAPTLDNWDFTRTKTEYTFTEAIEYMKQLDKGPTIGSGPRWVDQNGKPVSIGYSK